MPIACDDEVRTGVNRALNDAVGGFILDHMETRSDPDYAGNAADRLHQFPRLFFRPVKLALENCGRLGEDRDGSKEFESSLEHVQVGFFRLAPRNGKGRNVNVCVEDDPHGQRFWKTKASTSASVSITFLRACLAP